MKVLLLRDWEGTDIMRQTPGSKGEWDGICFTEDPTDDFDFLVVMNRPARDLHLPCADGRAWLISMEPPSVIHQWMRESFPYFDRVFSPFPTPRHPGWQASHGCLPWSIDRTYDELTTLTLEPGHKADRVSVIASSLDFMQGHEHRHRLIQALESSGFAFDRFGRGVNPVDDKFDALYPYKYSLAIENSSYPDYWTEKIADCFLTWTMPIYWGCPNISRYFPESSLIRIDPTRPRQARRIMQSAVEEDRWSENLEAIAEARERVLNEHQLFPFIAHRVERAGLPAGGAPVQARFFPYNPAPHEVRDGRVVRKESLYRRAQRRLRRVLNIKPY